MATSVTPLHPVFAAEVRGIDLTKPVDPAAFADVSDNSPPRLAAVPLTESA